MYLFIGPPECLDDNGNGESIPPFLYGSLFAFVIVLTLSILNENIIFSISIKGNIMDTRNKRKYLIYWLFLRVVLISIETIGILVCMIAVFGPAPYAAGALVCEEYHDGPLVFAKVIVVVMLVTQLVYTIGFFIFMDPLGICCSPSIMQDMNRSENYATKSRKEMEEEENSYAKNDRLGHLHRSSFGYRKVFGKVKGILCCLDANGNRSRKTAMQEMALALHTLFSEDNWVPSDLVAGLIMVSRYQRSKKEACLPCIVGGMKCPCSYEELKKVLFNCCLA